MAERPDMLSYQPIVEDKTAHQVIDNCLFHLTDKFMGKYQIKPKLLKEFAGQKWPESTAAELLKQFEVYLETRNPAYGVNVSPDFADFIENSIEIAKMYKLVDFWRLEEKDGRSAKRIRAMAVFVQLVPRNILDALGFEFPQPRNGERLCIIGLHSRLTH